MADKPKIEDPALAAAVEAWHLAEMQAVVRRLGEETAALNKAHTDERAAELAALKANHNAAKVAIVQKVQALADELLLTTKEGRDAERARLIAEREDELAKLRAM